MAQQALNNLGLNNNWDTGASGWKAGVDNNFLLLDGLVQSNVFTRATTAPPSAPAAGDRYLIPHTGATGAWAAHPDAYAAWSGSAWVFAAPIEGWTTYVLDENLELIFNGSGWKPRKPVAFGLTASSTSGVLTLDTSLAEVFDILLHENVTTLTLSNAVAAPNVTRVLLRLTQNSTGGYTIAWPTYKTVAGTAYVVSAAANAVDLVRLTSFDAGSIWYLEPSKGFA